MTCELGAVVEGHRTAPWGRERGQHLGHGTGDWVCRLARLPQGDEQTGVALVQGEDRLPLSAEEHQVRLPVAGGIPSGGIPSGGIRGTLGQWPAKLDEGRRVATLVSPPAAFRLGPGQVMTPGVVLLAGNLGIDETVDSLIGNDGPASLQGQASCHLLRRPVLPEAGEHLLSERIIPLQLGAVPAAGMSLLIGITRLIALGA